MTLEAGQIWGNGSFTIEILAVSARYVEAVYRLSPNAGEVGRIFVQPRRDLAGWTEYAVCYKAPIPARSLAKAMSECLV